MSSLLRRERFDLRAASDEQLLAVAVQAYQEGLRALDGTRHLTDILDLRARTVAAEQYLGRMLRGRAVRLQAQNLLAELRLREERAIGHYLAGFVNHEGGGDRRSRSRERTAVRDLPEGITKNDSSRWQQLASIPDAAFERFLVVTRDAKRELTTAAALKLARPLRGSSGRRPPAVPPAQPASDLAALFRSGVRFGTVYADPPWRFDNTTSNGAAENHYPTMTTAEIVSLPVRRLAAEDSHCHLWTTTSFFPDALRVLAAWGFAYKSVFVWLKDGRLGCGNYWRVSTEFLLLGVRGRAPFAEHSIPNWISTRPGRHSEKPEEVRRLIEMVSPGPYLELFARRTAPNWTVWGDELPPVPALSCALHENDPPP
jgi:N6-adenosine-specific RNA methylase IME4